MRTAFINTLTEFARKNKDIFLLTGDLGFSVFENFKKEFPDRFFNIGVAEANMMGIAAGLALSRKVVFVYSIAPFLTMRCLEQIRNDICHQNLNVRLIGIGGGLTYGSLGMTHHSIEDISIMRSLTNMTVVCPGDPLETELVVRYSMKYQGPIYIRLGKSGDPKVHMKLKNFKIGKGIILKNGKDITLIATGNMLYNTRQVTESLIKKGISVRLISMHTVKPIDKEIIKKAAQETKAIFTLEEHSLIGGLGSAIAEVLVEEKVRIYFKRIALPDTCIKDIGNQEYLRAKFGLSAEKLEKSILEKYRSL